MNIFLSTICPSPNLTSHSMSLFRILISVDLTNFELMNWISLALVEQFWWFWWFIMVEWFCIFMYLNCINHNNCAQVLSFTRTTNRYITKATNTTVAWKFGGNWVVLEHCNRSNFAEFHCLLSANFGLLEISAMLDYHSKKLVLNDISCNLKHISRIHRSLCQLVMQCWSS